MATCYPHQKGKKLLSPLRRFLHNPKRILGAYVRAGDVVFEPGPGMGFFTLELAQMVGPSGHVFVSDIQPEMLYGLQERAREAGLNNRIEARQARPDSFGVEDVRGEIDFILSFAVTHEVADFNRFFSECNQLLKAGGQLLQVEPSLHVSKATFQQELDAALQNGFQIVETPSFFLSRAVLLEKG